MEEKTNFKHIVRIVNTDIKGTKQVCVGLTKIKGVGHIFANAVCSVTKTDKAKKVGDLTTSEVTKINDLIKNPEAFPKWMFNRRKDPETGQDRHLVSSDVTFIRDNDIKVMRRIKSYKGSRHTAGLPCRGQQTKSNFRKNKKATGIKRKKK